MSVLKIQNFDLIEKNQIIIEYVFRDMQGWAGDPSLQFHSVCAEAGLSSILPYSINSGFIMWNGYQSGFKKALDLIQSITLFDPKGLKGDEYYICAGLQMESAKIKPIDYNLIKLGKFWNGDISLRNDKLVCTAYPLDDRLIHHYGNGNFYHPSVQKILREHGLRESYSFDVFKFFLRLLFRKIKRFLLIKLLKQE